MNANSQYSLPQGPYMNCCSPSSIPTFPKGKKNGLHCQEGHLWESNKTPLPGGLALYSLFIFCSSSVPPKSRRVQENKTILFGFDYGKPYNHTPLQILFSQERTFLLRSNLSCLHLLYQNLSGAPASCGAEIKYSRSLGESQGKEGRRSWNSKKLKRTEKVHSVACFLLADPISYSFAQEMFTELVYKALLKVRQSVKQCWGLESDPQSMVPGNSQRCLTTEVFLTSSCCPASSQAHHSTPKTSHTFFCFSFPTQVFVQEHLCRVSREAQQDSSLSQAF